MSNRGQILPLALMMVLAMAGFWVMLLNAGQLFIGRVQLQNAADTAAQSACAIRARGLNAVGLLNKWLTIPVGGIGIPEMCWWPAPPHQLDNRVLEEKKDEIVRAVKAIKKMIRTGFDQDSMQYASLGALVVLTSFLGLSFDKHPKRQPDYTRRQRTFVSTLRTLQEGYLKTYGGGLASRRARGVAKEQGADNIYVPTQMYTLGLERNRGIIYYLPTLHVWPPKSKYPIPAPGMPEPDDAKLTEDPGKRWYQQRADFARKSLRVYAFRRSDSPRNGNFPWGKSFLKVQMPPLYAVAAARVYNPRGPMFPAPHQSTGFWTGKAAKQEYDRAARWWAQLIPVGGFYAH